MFSFRELQYKILNRKSESFEEVDSDSGRNTKHQQFQREK